eukprot:TRINITY_DN189_c0_g1_i1.p1 TRINITY_DN189_c0_g1~~TRINITY_DN189_c0_g1_i1.p1  ORF type:complete len:475 (+),score=160.03 TRINITY_DN189_c0_g1_i1:74-1498(+)
MSLETAIKSLVSRLETVTSRLEKVEGQIASGAGASAGASASASASAGGDGSDSAAVREYDDLINTHIRPFVSVSTGIAPEVKEQAELVLKAAEAQKKFIGVAAASKKPADSALQPLIAPTADLMGQIVAIRDKNRTSKFFNNLSAVSEGISALGWVLVTPTPGPHIADMRGGSEFYSNRVLKDFKGKDQVQVDQVSNFNNFLKELQTYVKKHHTTGLSWNPRGGDVSAAAAAPAPAPSAGGPPPPPAGGPPKDTTPAAKGPDMGALFGALNQGTGVTSGLKKVTNDMKTKNMTDRSAVVPAGGSKAKKDDTPAVTKPSSLRLDGNKWVVEYFVGKKDIVISETETRHTVYVYNCHNSTIQIKGKVNSIAIDNCKRTAVVFESAISGVEVVNGASIEVQITGKVPSVAIDKTSGMQLYLSKDSVEAEIVTSKISEMNILIPGPEGGDFIEIPVPEQYKTVVKGDKLVTECVHHSG